MRTPSLRAVPIAAVALVLAAGAAHAQPDQRLERARVRCEDQARNAGYRIQSREREQRLASGDYLIRYNLRRDGRTVAQDCSYDWRRDRAFLEAPDENDTYGNEAVLREARRQCTDLARTDGYTVERFTSEREVDDREWLLRAQLRRSGRLTNHDCYYDELRRRARFPSLSGGGGGDVEEWEDIADRARQRCTAVARDLGYSVERFTSQRQGEGREWELRMRLRRSGRTTTHDCFFNSRRDRARIPSLAGGGPVAVVERAREQCGVVAREHGYEVERYTAEREVDAGQWVLRAQLRRAGRATAVHDCYYNVRQGLANIPSIAGGGPVVPADSLRERARAACDAGARRNGYTVRSVGEARDVGNGVYEVPVQANLGGLGMTVRCRYDRNTDTANVP
ncbi:MAG TPA: hypothetical protein VFX98_04100 [Longimicrobiaceae bacterium]|nr:hypothetical protein [Longimicrobiaceae bacterium]